MKCRRSKKNEGSSLRALVFRLLLVLYICAVAFFCFGKFDNLPDVERFYFGIPTDKIVHFCMFFPFPILGYFSFDRKKKSLGKAIVSLIMVCSFGCIFAGITEIIQGMLPYRSEDVKDFGADCLAICTSALIVFVIEVFKNRKKK